MSKGRIEDIYPLSPLQQGMLFHTLYAPESGVYFQQMSFRLEGDLDAAAMREAWQRVLVAMPPLRTSFVWENRKEPLQLVHRQVALPCIEEDWRDLEADGQRRRLAERLAGERHAGFILSKVPLLHLTLLRLGERSYQLVWSFHHLLLDGWSVPRVLKEVFDAYEVLRIGGEPRIDPGRPFSAYIAWLKGRDEAEAEAYWRRTLAELTAPTSLGERLPRAAPEDGPRFDEWTGRLSPVRTASLQTLARQCRLTLNTLVQAAWALLLSRYSGQEDVVFGATVSGRSQLLDGAESMVGVLMNTLPVRVLLPAGETLIACLQRLQASQLDARQFEHSSLVQIQGWSELPPGTPLFQTVLVFENYPVEASLQERTGSLRVREVWGFQQSNYPLTLMASASGQVSLRLLFDRSGFEPVTALRLLGELESLLADMPAGPERRLGALGLLAPAQRHQILLEWNDTGTFRTPSRLLHQPFERRAERAPDAVAVVFEERSWTYGEVDRGADRLARSLRDLGIGPGDFVAVCMERCAEMIVAVLGVLKAGAAYVPLETGFPDARIRFILSSLRISCLVTQERLMPRWRGLGAEPFPRHLIPLDARATEPERAGAGVGPSRVGDDDAAYVIFTSGSTGTPKGVLVRHRPVLNLIDWVGRTFSVGAGDRVLLVASLCFDLSVYDIFGVLGAGGSVLVASDVDVREPSRLVRLLLEGGVTFWDSAPAALQQLVPLLPEEAVAGATPRLFFLSGDWIPLSLPGRIGAAFPAARVVSLGGATEATVWSNWFPVREVDPGWGSIPYGRPIHNARYHVLDKEMEPCAISIEGDLYIGGGCLAAGYSGEPVLTAGKFVPDPFGGEPGAVLYRTGDRARYWPDGNLEFLGRRDSQVKVRGFRIELEEIEAVLGEHQEVWHAVVLALPDTGGDKRLMAFVVPKAQPGPSAAALKQFVAGRLPSYMIPAFIVHVESLPVTPNGKLDRRALAGLDPGRPPETVGCVALQTPCEQLVAGIWEEILGVERVGAADDFFELGGHSLLATRLTSRLRQVFQVDIPLRRIFEAPTLAGLVRAVEEARRGEDGPQAPPMARVPRGGELPLSFAQQRLWFLDQMEPGSPAYNISSSVRLQGDLRVHLLRRALDELLRRHEALRTTFPAVAGRPFQRIAPAAAQPLPVVDLRGLAEERRAAEVRDLSGREAALPFDLSRGPLLRSSLLRLAADEHVVLFTMHHIVSDGWSMGVFVRELGLLYEAFLEGRPPALPELPLQYADFACWQREWLQGEALEAQLAYWRRHLAGLPEALDLPVDRPRLAGRTFHGSLLSTRLPEELAAAVRRSSRQEGASLFMSLLAAFQLLLARLSGLQDVAVGTPIAGRNRAETEGMIGFFVNTLVLRTDLSGPLSWRDLLGRVREVALDAYARQDLPFEKLVEELQPRREAGRTPLFQVFFNMLNLPEQQIPLPGLILEAAAYEDVGSKFELTLYLIEREGRIALDWSYDARLFDRARIAGMARQLEALLAQAMERPEEPVEGWSLLTAEAAALLPDPRAPLAARWPGPAHQLFAGHAARDPERTAVTDAHGAWTYGMLDRKSARLANRLRAAGLGTGDVVAVYACRGASLVWALLGVLRAGAAFVILDASYPGARLAGYVASVRPRGWLDLAGAGPLPDALAAQVDSFPLACRLALPARLDEPVLDGWPEELPRLCVQPGDLAYVAFTSGSTGSPKGILGGHGPLAHFLDWHAGRFGLDAADRFSLLSGLSHDPLLRDIFTPLSVGAALHVPAADLLRDPQRLRAWMAQEAVTVAHLTPAQAQILCDEAGSEPLLPRLRYAFFGGAVLSYRLAGRLRLLAPAVTCVSFYGATETPQAMAAFTLPPGEGDGGAPVPLGTGIEGAQILVLRRAGERLDLAGIGEPGEICVRTPCLSQGYLGEPEVTAERFIANPFTGAPADLLYRTGDLGRYRPDGTVDFLGRADDQVNLRGHRIEPAEVEAALERHAAVRQALVLACLQERMSPAGDPELRLVAWVVAGSPRPTTRELRQHLLELLPEAMVPSAFVLLDSLPLTPNGKIDRRQLRDLVVQEELPQREREARSPLEEVLAEIWSELLPARPVGMDDDFFESGGHSLLATQLVSRARQAAGVELSLTDFFSAPSVSGLARLLEARLRGGADPQAPPLLPVPRGGGLPLSSAQRRLWILERLSPGDPAYIMPTAMRLSGRLDIASLERSLNEIVRRHESLRTSFVEVDRSPLQIIAPDAAVALPVIDLSGLGEGARQAETARIGTAEIRRPFDLARPPLLRAALLRLGPEEHAAFFAMHHIVSDGWSMGVLVRETTELYAACVTGAPPSLPDLPVQYADYAAWQHRWFSGEVREAQLSYWLRQLEGVPPLLDLPGDNPRPAVQTSRGALMGWTFPEGILPALQELQRRERVTLFMALLAAFQVQMRWYSGQDDFVVGTDVANRTRLEAEGLIGFFVNQLPLRARLGGAFTFSQILRQVRTTTLESYSNQDLPFDTLVESLRLERNLAYSPLIQVKLNLLSFPRPDLRLPGLTLSPLDLPNGVAQLDLIVDLIEMDGVLRGSCQYRSDLFKGTTIRRFWQHFQTLLERIAARPDLEVGELERSLADSDRESRALERNRFQQSRSRLLQARIGTASAQAGRDGAA